MGIETVSTEIVVNTPDEIWNSYNKHNIHEQQKSVILHRFSYLKTEAPYFWICLFSFVTNVV